MSIEQPNYTQVPNSLLDNMDQLSDAELRITLGLIRKIVGYHKEQPEPVSYSQLMELTGLSRQGVRNGVKSAITRGNVKQAGKGKQGVTLYTINFSESPESELVNVVDQSTELTATSQRSRPQLVNVVDTQKKDSKEKEIKDLSEPVGTDSDATPKPPRARSAAQLKLDAMINAIADAFELEHDKVTDTQWNEFRKAGRDLLKAGANPGDMKLLHAWCTRQNWKTFSSVAMAKNYANFEKTRRCTGAENGATAPAAMKTREALYGGES